LKHYGIDKVRVIYIGKDKGEKETYAKESPDLLRRFFGLYKIPVEAMGTLFREFRKRINGPWV
jgi:hypothetical protein